MKLLVLIPTRGDRPTFLDQALRMMRRQGQHLEPGTQAWPHLVDYAPKSDAVDIVERVQLGCASQFAAASDAIVMWEDDDYYPPTYLATVARKLEGCDVVAPEFTTYYNVRTRRWRVMSGPTLMEMAWRTEALEHAQWPPPGKINVDRHLACGFREAGLRFDKSVSPHADRPIGIKHGVGKCAGVGHTMPLLHEDLDLRYLRERVQNEESLAFYSEFYDASASTTTGR